MADTDDTAGALSVSEAAELQGYEAEMRDSRGRQAADWRSHYWASPEKQRRTQQLYEKQSGPPAGTSRGVAAKDADARLKELMTSEDYWTSDEKQAEANRLIHASMGEEEGAVASEPQADATAVPAWADALGITDAEAHGMFHRAREFAQEVGNTAEIDGAFMGLSDGLQRAIYTALATPARRQELVRSLTPEEYEEAVVFIEGMTDAEYVAAEKVLGLA
jgi:hypothetical protein